MGELRVITSNTELREEFRATGLMADGGAGDTRVSWDPKNKEEVAKAEKLFNDLKKAGYTFFSTSKGNKGKRIDAFPKRSRTGEVIAEVEDVKAVAVPRVAGG